MSKKQLAEITEDLIERVINRIVETINPEKIILFDSAQNNESSANDLDLLVISETPPGKNCRDLSRDLHGLFEGWFLPLDIIVLTPAKFRKRQGNIWSHSSNCPEGRQNCLWQWNLPKNL